ncbi:MAG: hypothetical protein EZS28_050977, partial [Streblomastix strix]
MDRASEYNVEGGLL